MAEVIVALDAPSGDDALRLVTRMGDELDFVKVGLELFTREGPDIVRALRGRGLRVFLDLKLLDIPNTVAGAVRAAAALDVSLLTVHASGGRRMLRAAARAASGSTASGSTPPTLLAVTVLTSLSADELADAWGRGAADPAVEAVRLACLAREEGIDGVVASAQEARALRDVIGPRAPLVTPGIRPAGTDRGDQIRVATPREAILAGADHLVVGRAVTADPDPARALGAIRREVAGAVGVNR